MSALDDIKFPHPKLTPIVGEPKYDTIRNMEQELLKNATEIKTSFDGGNVGMAGLILSDLDYTNLTGRNFTPPPEPPPLHLPHLLTAAQIAQIQDRCRKERETYNNYIDAVRILRSQLIEAVEDKYIAALKQPRLLYSNRSVRELLNHLYENYSDIDCFDLEENKDKMSKGYIETDPIDVLFEKLENAQDFAYHGGDPLTEQTLINAGLSNLMRIPDYRESIRDWYRLQQDQRTWRNFKTHFARASKEIKRANKLGPNPYQANQAELEALLCNASEEISTLSAEMQNEREQVHAVLEQNKKLEDQNKKLQNQLTDAIRKLTQATQTFQQWTQQQQGSFPTQQPFQQYQNTPPFQVQNPNQSYFQGNSNPMDHGKKKAYYCWTHGYFTRPGHTSQTCTRPAANHIRTATAYQPQGGSMQGLARFMQ